MSNYTKAPWAINTAGSAKNGEPFKITEIYVYAPETQDDTAICADIIDPITQEPSEANARLIAAAPELLEALIGILDAAENFYIEGAVNPDKCKDIQAARAAIAKANGETQ